MGLKLLLRIMVDRFVVGFFLMGRRILLVRSFIFVPSMMCSMFGVWMFSGGFTTRMDIVIGLGYPGSSLMWYCLLMGWESSALMHLGLMWTSKCC